MMAAGALHNNIPPLCSLRISLSDKSDHSDTVQPVTPNGIIDTTAVTTTRPPYHLRYDAPTPLDLVNNTT